MEMSASSSSTSDEDTNENKKKKNVKKPPKRASSDDEEELENIDDGHDLIIDDSLDEGSVDLEDEEKDVPSSSKKKEKKRREKKVPKDDAVDGECVVEGFVYGLNKNHLQGAYNFRILKRIRGKKGIPKIFSIKRSTSLPTYCPWFKYKVKIRPPKENKEGMYEILEVLGCTFNTIKKDEVKQYIVHQYRTTEDNAENFKKRVTKTFKKVPKEIKCKADIEDNITDEYIKARTLGILEPRFRGQAILSLLPYFSYDFLAKIDDTQALTILYMVIEMPYIFCFWDKFLSIVTELKFGGRYLFPNKNGELDQDIGYVYKLSERLDQQNSYPIYDPSYPSWCPEMLKKAVRDFKRWDYDTFDFDAIKMALKIYLQYHREKNSFKNTLLLLDETNGVKTNNEDCIKAIDFLRSKKILISRSDLAFFFEHPIEEADNYKLMDPITSILEIEFAVLIRQKVKDIALFNIRDYSEDYINVFKSVIKENVLEKKGALSKTVWLSANKNCVRYMKNETGLNFQTTAEYIKSQRKIEASKKEKKRKREDDEEVGQSIFVFDKLHKYGLLELVELLRSIKDQASFCIFGDMNEYGPNSKRGTHHMFYEFSQVFETQNTEPDVESTLSNLRRDLANGRIKNVDVEELSNTKNMDAMLDNIEIKIDSENVETKNKKRKHWSPMKRAEVELNNGSYSLFCSNENDKQTITSILFSKKKRQYKRNEFKMWDKVQIMEDDIIGRIQNIWRTDSHGNNMMQITDNKQFFNTLKGSHSFSLFGSPTVTYNTSKISVEHAEVSIISKYAGPASDYIIFIAGPDTPFNDLVVASKYARKEFKVLLLPGAQLHDIYNKRRNMFNRQYRSDLHNKFTMID
jgi:hypothetical protein